MPTHKGQIAFPGGKREEEDIDIVSTAVRESTEELLLPVSAIRPFGYLNSIDTVEYKFDVLICPTTALPAVKADIDILKDKVIINGREMSSPDLGWTMAYPFNILSRLPVLSVPSGLSSNNIPTGIQIIGKPYEDIEVFQAGYNFEKIEPWYNNSKLSPNI